MPVDDFSLTLTVNVTGDCLSQWHGGLLGREKKPMKTSWWGDSRRNIT